MGSPIVKVMTVNADKPVNARILLALVLWGMAVAVPLFPQEEDGQAEQPQDEPQPLTAPVISEVETWRETLRFGINSQVAELLPTLTRNREETLIPEVLELFNTSNNRDVLRESANYLRELQVDQGHPRALDLMMQWFDRPSELMVAVLNYLRESEVVLEEEHRESLLEMSRTTPVIRALAAVRLLAANTDDVDALLELYEDPGIHEDVQGRILVELGERGDPRAFDFVAAIIGEDEEAQTALQRFAIDTLGKLGDPRALPIILRQLDSSDAQTRAYAVNALTRFDEEEAVRGIEAALRDQFWRVRISALQTVAERQLERAAPAVLFMMRRDPERPVRVQAIRTAAALGRDDGWELILERIADERVNIQERVVMIEEALRLNAAASVPVLAEVMDKEWTRENSVVLDAIGRTLSTTESGQIAPLVEKLLQHSNFIIQIYGLRSAGRNGMTQFLEIIQERESAAAHPMVRTAAARAREDITR